MEVVAGAGDRQCKQYRIVPNNINDSLSIHPLFLFPFSFFFYFPFEFYFSYTHIKLLKRYSALI